MKENLSNIVEAILFAAEQPIKRPFLLDVLNGDIRQQDESAEGGKEGEQTEDAPSVPVNKEELDEVLEGLVKKYQADDYPFEVREVAEGFQFFTKRAYYAFIKKASLTKNQKRLSRAALETLSIIAYRQPITKAEMEFIRGVNCDYAVNKLLDKQLVSIVGRAEAAGRPLLYAASPFFMQYFGIKDMTDLPKLKEFSELPEELMDQFRQQTKQEDATQAQEFEGSLLEGAEGGEARPETEADGGQPQDPEPTIGDPEGQGSGEEQVQESGESS